MVDVKVGDEGGRRSRKVKFFSLTIVCSICDQLPGTITDEPGARET